MSLIDKLFRKNVHSDEREDKSGIDYLGKIVNQNGTALGESIAVKEGRIMVKNSEEFLSIPLEAVLENTETIAVGDFNREESLRLGKEWFEKRDTLRFDEKGMLIMNHGRV